MSWTCPKCERELPKPEQRHYCARVSLDSLFRDRPPELVLVFDKILAEVADWEGVLVGTTPNCIVFTRRLTFLVIRPMKKELDIKFYSKVPHPERPVLKSVASGNKFENHIRIALLDDLRPKLFLYLRESYELL
ncbi:DUF5655 domain-containing protein [Mucilaginibacter sp. KACC 22773]|jgi:hypothetical protein|uniref:DUF5655 domain-containing protein n=1 Tax=Mucilaginibacter sp. KACC 22773 TaxID=3025671 RepID=UPI0023667C4D|nr:DUF5655 domain-containing protein [Mucilaginibacter sp. KACC 22773]WDF77348.1 DUF5655 domain-containing protein [Mucilaginibacter sp. KACC 22773]